MIGLCLSPAAYAADGFSPADLRKIVDAMRRLQAAPDGKWAFAVITEQGSHRFVQFYAHDAAAIFDFPLSMATRDATQKVVKDGDCTAALPALGFAVKLEDQMPPDEQQRLVRLLDAKHIHWHHQYCISLDRSGGPVGYSHTIQGDVGLAEQAPGFGLDVFRAVYRLSEIKGLVVERD